MLPHLSGRGFRLRRRGRSKFLRCQWDVGHLSAAELLFLLTHIKTRTGPQKTNLLGARYGINWLEDKDFRLL